MAAKKDVIVETKYADGTVKVRKGDKVEMKPPKKAKGATAPSTSSGQAPVAKVTRARANKGTVAVEYPEAPSTNSGQAKVEALCMKCKQKVEAVETKKVVVSGKNAVQGKCPNCGTAVFRFTGGTTGKAVAKKAASAKPKANKNSKPKLSSKAQSAYDKAEKAGVLDDCWVGQLKSGAAIWWEGSAQEGWHICMDDIQEAEMGEFKKLVLKSL